MGPTILTVCDFFMVLTEVLSVESVISTKENFLGYQRTSCQRRRGYLLDVFVSCHCKWFFVGIISFCK